MPKLNSHTHCQVAPADPQAKTWQGVCLFQRTTDRQSERKKNTERTTAVWRNGGFSASYDSFVVGSSAVLQLNFCAKNPPLRQAAKRCRQFLMKRLQTILFLLTSTLALGQRQYPFEKYPTVKFTEYKDWKVYNKTDKIDFTLTIPNFFPNRDSLTIQLTSFDAKWDSSYIRIFRNKKQIQKTFEPMFFTDMNVPHTSIRTLDVNGDNQTDIKLLIPYMGNGLAALNERVIYLFQKSDGLFTKISYMDKMGVHITERDFDNDKKFEILTMTLKGHENHNYWTFNVYNFKDGELVNQNERFEYPIMIQFLFKDNHKVTDKISAQKMKTFGDNKPEDYRKE